MSATKGTRYTQFSSTDYFQSLPQVQVPEFFRKEKGSVRKRKRRCTNPSFMPEIRILRRDIRRRYAEMIVNVVNSHDVPLLQKFCDDIIRQDCQIIRPNLPLNRVGKAIAQLLYQEDSHYHRLTGFHYLVSEYSFHSEMMPDCIFLLQESYLKLKQGVSGCIITAKISSRGTQTFHIESEKQRLNCIPVVPPIYAISDAMLTLVLDEENRVQRLHIESFLVSEGPVPYSYIV